MNLQHRVQAIFTQLQVPLPAAGALAVRSPIDQSVIATLSPTPLASVEPIVHSAQAAFEAWRQVPPWVSWCVSTKQR
jgi:acyl-CoA reductase-like NAD-dependent aldehyde dehydrogenase